jgi:tetratricopeptide (TPR) repeat protein
MMPFKQLYSFYSLLIILNSFVFLLLLCSCNKGKNEYTPYTAFENNELNFIGSTSCITCHQEEYKAWNNSHHDQAMKIADSTTILANFNNTTFSNHNIKSTFFKKDGTYYVNLEGSNGEFQDYKIVYTFGVSPLQQYIIEFPNGALQCLQTAWDTEKNLWFDIQKDIEIKNNEWIHWSGGAMRWNTSCADCHSTDVRKNYDLKNNSYKTTFAEINVSCESCHGPSSGHVQYYTDSIKGIKPPKLYMTKNMASSELVDKCARCHSRRAQITSYFDYQGQFLDHYDPSLLVHPIYELDGQIKDEDYVYGSFIQSKMYHNNVSCNDCHNPHSLELKKTGNTLCLSCHLPKYDTEEHHFHKEDTEASQCITCHMTGKYYMGNDFRRDHSFRVPRPDQTLNYGTPNACNECHKDKDAKWASNTIVEKYGKIREDHFSDYLLSGSQGNNESYYVLFSQKKYPDIARATALNQYSNETLSDTQLDELVKFLKDSSALIRNEAIKSFEKSSNKSYSKYIEPLLQDSVRLIRISAARYFNSENSLVTQSKAFKDAQKEYMIALDIVADFAGGQHQIALYHESKGNIDDAISAYKKSIKIDNFYNQSRMNLALLYYQKGNLEETEKLYLKVIEQEPNFAYAYYMLGLAYNEMGKPNESKKYLLQASLKDPNNINAIYNYSLLLQKENAFIESIKFLNTAINRFPDNERLLYAKLSALLNTGQFKESYLTCSKLMEIAPQNQEYVKIMEMLNNQIKN